MIYPRIAAVAAVVVLSSAGVAQGFPPIVEIVECGQVVERAIGRMTHDLDCSSFDGDSLTLIRAELWMRGFTITGNSSPLADPFGGRRNVIYCDVSCRITGPGLVTGGAIKSTPHDCQREAAIDMADTRKSRIERVTVSGNLGSGIEAGRRTRIENSVITDNGRTGICRSGSLKVRNVVVARNGSRGFFNLGGNGNAVIIDSEVVDNVAQGVMLSFTRNRGLRLVRTTVTGNASSQEACDMGQVPPAACADIVKHTLRPSPLRVRDVTCGTSADRETGEPLGICSDD